VSSLHASKLKSLALPDACFERLEFGIIRGTIDATNSNLRVQIPTRPMCKMKVSAISSAITLAWISSGRCHTGCAAGPRCPLAAKKGWFTGDNPANPVTLPEMTRKEAHALTLAQVKRLLEVMQYPEKEMALLAILTSMNIAEICGLQWKYVNLTETWLSIDGEPIPPKTIAVRRQWYRGELLEPNWRSRNRNLSISDLLFPMLLGLSQRAKYTGPDDFVLASLAGTPINEHYISARRLKPIGKALQMPWLSWRVFRRTRASLLNELERQCHELGVRPPEPTLSVSASVEHPVSGPADRANSIWASFKSWASRVG
jgi:integrase